MGLSQRAALSGPPPPVSGAAGELALGLYKELQETKEALGVKGGGGSRAPMIVEQGFPNPPGSVKPGTSLTDEGFHREFLAGV